MDHTLLPMDVFRSLTGYSRTFLLVALLLPVLAHSGKAGEKPDYNYRYSWQNEEGVASERVYLLLHFGVTRRGVSERVKEQIKNWEQTKEVEDTGREISATLDAGTEDAGLDMPEIAATHAEKKQNWKPKPLDRSKLGPDQIQDYSWHRRVFTLGDGVSITEQGKFGSGLRCSGEGGIVCEGLNARPPEDYPFEFKSKMEHAGVSAWVKVDDYPEETVCILHSIATSDLKEMDERTPAAKLLLHPDGKVELRLRHRHGHPRWQSMTGKKEAMKHYLSTPPSHITSKKPVPTGEWIWIRIYNNSPVVQGPGCYRAELAINNVKQDSFLTPRGVQYSVAPGTVIIGNSLEGDQGFEGLIDDVMATNGDIDYYPTPSQEWRDLESQRTVSFGKPHFFRNGALFHAPLGKTRKYDFHRGGTDKVDFNAGADFERLTVPGVRGQGWRIEPCTALPRFSLEGMSPEEGSVEFWFRPVNFDNATRVRRSRKTGKLSHFRPLLNAIRFYGTRKSKKEKKLFLTMHFPRGRMVREPFIHPNDWFHVVVLWEKGQAAAYINGEEWKGKVHLADGAQDLELKTMEVGITDKVLVKHGHPPQIDIDEMAAYNYALHEREIRHAHVRWKKDAGPLKFFSIKSSPRWRIGELDVKVTTKFPPGLKPGRAIVSVLTPEGDVLFKPTEKDITSGEAEFNFKAGRQFPQADYTARIKITDVQGQQVVDGKAKVDVTPPPMYSETAGVLDSPPPPWTPIKFENRRVKTRMTEYVLGKNGLPKTIITSDKNLLSRPAYLEESGHPMKADRFKRVESSPTAAVWETTFRGNTCDVYVRWDCDYDGCVKWTLLPQPKKDTVAPLRLVFPLNSERAKRYMQNMARARGARTGVVPDKDGIVFDTRVYAWQKLKHRARRRRKLEVPALEEFRGYAFTNTLDVHDLNRGLYWFADNAIGWWQSDTRPAQRIEKKGDEVLIRLNLIAEPVKREKLLSKHIGPRWAPPIPRVKKAERNLEPHVRPIVFGVLPHPARPFADHHRLMDRANRHESPDYCSVYGTTFMTWPLEDRGHGHRVWPIKGNYDLAEKAREAKDKVGVFGSLIMYHGWWFMGFRGGGPDYWEMYSKHPTFTPDLVDHLCWEWNQWAKRGCYQGWYADEDYTDRLNNVKAGLAVRFPNGKVQPGEPYWGKRAFTKRSRNISHQYDEGPAYVTHCSVIHSFHYSHLVFADSYLHGEGRGGMIGGHRARGFVRSVPLQRVETLQNARLWGITPAWYACIWEHGKETSHKRWAWRMARGCNSVLAHLECFVPFCETSGVFNKYWRDVIEWGAMDPREVPFIPYWNTEPYLQVDGMRDEVLVSFYKDDGRILLIASNRTQEPKNIRVKLDLKALGLPEDISVKRYDRSYPPREGKDFLSNEEVKKRRKEIKQDLMEGEVTDEDGLGLGEKNVDDLFKDETPEEREEKEKKAQKPKVEGENVLVLPTRPEDFSLVSVE
ncbi:MAG: LamG-like jellyroll fold domain-containing protein [Candidatus Brocadiia bacterium]